MSEDRVTVVLDTNVFVAAYWAPSSASARLIRACMEGTVRAQYTPEVRREVEHVLRTIKVRESYYAEIGEFWEKAEETRGVPVPSISVDDPDDVKYIEAAAGGDTDFLVTNDDHLLRIGYVGRTEILTPGSAARVLGL